MPFGLYGYPDIPSGVAPGIDFGRSEAAMADPDAEAVKQLLGQLEFAKPTPPPKVGLGRTILGTIGDALIAAGRARAGQGGGGLGPFASTIMAQRQNYEQQQAESEQSARDLRNQIRVGVFQSNQAARLKARPSMETKEGESFVTEALARENGLPPEAVGQVWSVRDIVDPQSGMTIATQYLRPTKPDAEKGDKAPQKSEYDTTIEPWMISRFGLDPSLKGQQRRVRSVIGPTGVTAKMEDLGPIVESSKLVITPEGIIPFGPKTGAVGAPLVNPKTGEQLTSFQKELLNIRLRNEQDVKERAARLPGPVQSDLTDQGTAMDSAAYAIRRYVEAGKPDLGLQFAMTLDRWKDPRSVDALLAIQSAVLPIKKFFSGTAVTPEERKAAEPLIPMLESGVAPNLLEPALLTLLNMARRVRRRILTDAEGNQQDISRYRHELVDGSLSELNSIDDLVSGATPVVKAKDRAVVVE